LLAWTRTSFALLANGALLTIKNLHSEDGLPGLIPALLAATAASCTYVIALQRQRTLEQRPIPAQINPRRQVYIVGIAVMVLIAVTAGAQLL
jgi:flagellar biosynthesis component FlhA